jgi:purine-nucleoside phosphorylase
MEECMSAESPDRDWKHHMRENVSNWLLGSKRDCLHPNGLMLFGNPYLFQREAFLRHFTQIESVGQFTNAIHNGRPVTFCYPVFGAPMAAMYTEIMIDNGVRNIVACGYVGGVAPSAAIGSYGLVTSATGFDGTSISYGLGRTEVSASAKLVDALHGKMEARKARCHRGSLASIDALMLEDDRMITGLRSNGCAFIDLETTCLFALAKAPNVSAAALHIVTDNPTCKEIDPTGSHEASFDEQIRVALSVLTELWLVSGWSVQSPWGLRKTRFSSTDSAALRPRLQPVAPGGSRMALQPCLLSLLSPVAYCLLPFNRPWAIIPMFPRWPSGNSGRRRWPCGFRER